MNTINDRLEIICNSLFKGNKSAMAQAIGLQPTGLSNYLGNKRRSKPNVDMIANLVQFCRIDAFWLLTGEGEMLSTDNSQRSVAVVSSTISDNSVVANEVYSSMDKTSMLQSLIDYYSDGVKSRFASKLNIKPQTINSWLKRDTFDPELIYSSCENISAAWLLSGDGDMLVSDSSNYSVAVIDSSVSGNSVVADEVYSPTQKDTSEIPILRERVAALERLLAEKERLIQLYESMNKPPKSGTETGQ